MKQLDLFRNRTGEYNIVYKYHWRTGMSGLPGETKNWLDDNCVGAWGWHFIRIPDDECEKVYQDELVLTFEDQYDLINAKLMLP